MIPSKLVASAFFTSTLSIRHRSRVVLPLSSIRNVFHYHTSSAALSKASSDDEESNGSSLRGRKSVELLPVYLTDARAVQQYDPKHCPDGALQLSVAENQMVEDLLLPAISTFLTTAPTSSSSSSQQQQPYLPFTSSQIYYQPTHGRPTLLHAFNQFLQRLLHLPTPMDENGLIVGAGCNAVLENLCFCLAEHGEGILIPTPYYAAFEFDLASRIGLEIIPVPTGRNGGTDPETYYPTREMLDDAFNEARCRPRILLLSHPCNPLGICYPERVLKECIEWARERKVHLIADEIYAGSVYRSPESFTSLLRLAATSSSSSTKDGLGLGPYIHFVYALSKDFALSGLRVGVAYTELEEIRLPMKKLNDLCQISSQTQGLVERMLMEPEWADEFLVEHRRRIWVRCVRLTKRLDWLEVPYLEATAGLFLWIDLSEFLPLKSFGGGDEERERMLYLELMQEYGLLLTPGMSMRNGMPGFFRCVFTAASEEEFEMALERIEWFVEAKRGI